jgi:hypothetical protein
VVNGVYAFSDEVKLVVGNGSQGPCAEGQLDNPFGLAVDSEGRLLIACMEGYTILRYDPTLPDGSNLVRLAGQPGQRWFCDGRGSDEALLGDVAFVAVDPFDTIYFCDYAHGLIRAISPDGTLYLSALCVPPRMGVHLVCFLALLFVVSFLLVSCLVLILAGVVVAIVGITGDIDCLVDGVSGVVVLYFNVFSIQIFFFQTRFRPAQALYIPWLVLTQSTRTCVLSLRPRLVCILIVSPWPGVHRVSL